MTVGFAVPRSRWTSALPLVVAVVATIVLVAVHPTLGDLQAAIAREEAARSGVGLSYWFGWFGGVSPGSYSLIVPWLSSALGSLPLLSIATVVIAVLAYPIAHVRPGASSPTYAAHPTMLTWAIAVAATVNMMSGRVAFAVGAAIALIGVLALGRGRAEIAGVILLVSGLASPLAPALVGIATVPLLAGNLRRSRNLWSVLVGAGLGVVTPFFLFGAPGAQGFPWTTLFWIVVIGVSASLTITSGPARWVIPFATLVAIVIFSFPNGVGSNVSRFFCLVVPAIVFFCSRRRVLILLIALIPAISYAGFVAIADQVAVADSPHPEQQYEPLRAALLAIPETANHRVELVDAGTHAGSHELGQSVTLARGWENQSDSRYNPIFHDQGALTPASYRRWLGDNAVAWIAVANDPLPQAVDEANLITAKLPYLTPMWSNNDWTLYRVASPTSIVRQPLSLVVESQSQMVVDVPDTGVHSIQIRPNRYLVARRIDDEAVNACIAENSDGWVNMTAPQPGRYVIEGALTFRTVFGEKPPACT